MIKRVALVLTAAVALLASACVPPPEPVGNPDGYVSSIFAPLDEYTVRLHTSALPMRDDVEWALRQVRRHTTVRFNVGPTTTSTIPNDQEIVVVVSSDCGGTAVGCARRWRHGEGRLIQRGSITVLPSHSNSHNTRPLLLHEFGHILGLDHYEGTLKGSYQIIHPFLIEGLRGFGEGDLRGLAAQGAVGAELIARHSPEGEIYETELGQTWLRLTGWATDIEDRPSYSQVQVVVNGKRAGARLHANGAVPHLAGQRPDLGGVHHGFNVYVPLGQGTHTVCVVGVNSGTGKDKTLGCKTVTMPTATSSTAPADPVALHEAPADEPAHSPAAEENEPELVVDVHDVYGDEESYRAGHRH